MRADSQGRVTELQLQEEIPQSLKLRGSRGRQVEISIKGDGDAARVRAAFVLGTLRMRLPALGNAVVAAPRRRARAVVDERIAHSAAFRLLRVGHGGQA